MGRIKVMIIDDSAVMRKFLSDTLSKSPAIEVVGTAIDPYIAVNKIKKLDPDVLTLDVEMPRMDGITFLSKLMIANPMPVIMVSSLTESGARVTMKALELGAVDYILKPNLDDNGSVDTFSDRPIEIVKMASVVRIMRKSRPAVPAMEVEAKHTADVILRKADPMKIKARSEKIIAIGASTGGTEVIDEMLTGLPENVPGIVVTQHMPEKFTKAFADRVNQKSRLTVKEAENNDRLYNGVALIAPGGRHMLLRNDSNGYFVEINDGPPVNRHKPSVDVLFRSVSQAAAASAVGIICTGMGNDGAAGILEMKQTGAETIAQNEASCVVFGMPREAINLGAVDLVMDIKGMVKHLTAMAK